MHQDHIPVKAEL